jgi:hypothetical protein
VRILSISDHEDIRLSRELLLKNAGYEVISSSSESAGEMPDDVQLVLIGQTVKDSDAARVIAVVRKAHPQVRIMRMRRQCEGGEADCDASCFVEDGPTAFLRCVSALLNSGHRTDCSE